MSVRRVMGTEIEYGISVLGQPTANPMVASSQVVNAYASATLKARRARWDFEEESPLRDARGFDLSRQVADPSQLTDEDIGLANVILTNGARLYVDHAHPEYSTPEVTNPLDIVRWDKAGEQVMLDAQRRASQLPNGAPIVLYKNNTDNKGASYGAHENYLMRRSTPFADIVRHLTPFFVSRQVVTGAGRVGIGQDGRDDGFQLSQRADFFEVEVGLETTLKRPDHQHPRRAARRPGEVPPAARHHRRRQPGRDLDVPQGRHHRAGAVDDRGPVPRRATLTVDGPVSALRAVSHDPTLKQTLDAGRRPDAHRASSSSWSTSTSPRSTSRTGTARTPTRRPSTCWPAGSRCWTGSSGTRCCAPPSSTGSPSSSCSSSTAQRDGLEWDDAKLAADRLPVLRHPPGEGPLPPARRRRPDRAAARRRRGRRRDARAAGGHPRLLPRPLPRQVRRRRRRRVLGLGDLRPARPGVAAAGADASTRCAAARRTSGSCSTARETAEALVAELTR